MRLGFLKFIFCYSKQDQKLQERKWFFIAVIIIVRFQKNDDVIP